MMPTEVHETDREAFGTHLDAVAADEPGRDVPEEDVHADEERPLPRRRRRSSGRRRSLRRARRRRRLLRSTMVVLLLAGLAGLGIWGATLLPLGLDRDGVSAGDDPVAAPGPTSTLVFVTFDEQRTPPVASLVFVLEADRDPVQGTTLFVPTTVVADIPGHGLDQLGRAYAFGGGPLLLSTLDNLLGVHFDGVVTISTSGWASVFERIGGLTIDVERRLVATEADGTSRVRFEPGTQHLDGPRLAEYLTFEEGVGDLDRLARASRVIDAMFAQLAADAARMDQLFAGGAPMFDTPVPSEELRSVLAAAVAAVEQDALESEILPVTPVGSGEDGSLRIDRERADQLIADRFADSIPSNAGQAGRRLQILNGNGEPGIGQEVAELLVPAGFEVRLTDNANSFDHETTRIIVYDDEPSQLALARDVQRALGVGQIEISRTPQSVVDITIVVGRDFLERGG